MGANWERIKSRFTWAGDARRVRKFLLNYPPYCPPIERRIKNLKEAELNFEFFMSERPNRMSALRTAFAVFEIELELNYSSLQAVSGWLYKYGAHLLDTDPPVNPYDCYRDHDPPWRDGIISYSAMFDIGTYLGEYVIKKNKSAKWVIDADFVGKRNRNSASAFQPCLGNLNKFIVAKPLHVHGEAIYACESSLSRQIGRSMVLSVYRKPDMLARTVDFYGESSPAKAYIPWID